MQHKTSRRVIAAGTGLLFFCLLLPAARADWNPGDPYKMHFPQLPDLTPRGLDVNATYWGQPPTGGPPIFPFNKVLADDWRCTETGPVSDIHIWGSWLGDRKFTGTVFKLSIHADIPASPTIPNSYSRPGALLWERTFTPAQYAQRIYATAQEQVWDPNTNQILGTDTLVWQYNFTDYPNPFIQQVDTIYWLDVQALVPAGPSPTAPEFVFGWKTSQQHFNDDAVYGDTDFFGGPPFPQFPDPAGGAGLLPWRDMHHPFPPHESLDMAFVITTVPEPASLAILAVTIIGAGMRRRR